MSTIKVKLVVMAFIVLSSFSVSNGNAGTYTWSCQYLHHDKVYAVRLVYSAQCPAAPPLPAEPTSSKTQGTKEAMPDHEGCIIKVVPNRV